MSSYASYVDAPHQKQMVTTCRSRPHTCRKHCVCALDRSHGRSLVPKHTTQVTPIVPLRQRMYVPVDADDLCLLFDRLSGYGGMSMFVCLSRYESCHYVSRADDEGG